MRTYKLFETIKKVKDLSKSPNISREASWELKCLADYLEGKYNFMVNLGKELNKRNANNQVNRARAK